jgi:hypothetical protein
MLEAKLTTGASISTPVVSITTVMMRDCPPSFFRREVRCVNDRRNLSPKLVLGESRGGKTLSGGGLGSLS